MAVALVMNANKNKYESLWNKLDNDLLVGQDSYPTTICGATHLLTNWKVNPLPPKTGMVKVEVVPAAVPEVVATVVEAVETEVMMETVEALQLVLLKHRSRSQLTKICLN